jgi:hypothetical protein
MEKEGDKWVKMRDAQGHTLLHWASLAGYEKVVEFLISKGSPINVKSENDYGPRPIHWACVYGHVHIVDYYLQRGISIEALDHNRCTPLIIAAQWGQSLVISYLLNKGANKEAMDINKDTALHWAAYKGHAEAVLLLLSWGLDPKQKDAYLQTPLHSASIGGEVQCVEMLLEHGADPTEADVNGKTPVALARGRKHKDLLRLYENKATGATSWNWKTIVYGPPGNRKLNILVLLVGIWCWAYPYYLYRIVPATLEYLFPLHLLFWLVCVVFWILYYFARFTDPGYIPTNRARYDEALKLVGNPSAWTNYNELNNPVFLLCHTCKLVKPIRAKHCRMCQRCVDHFDHHCFWLGKCIGWNNRVYFLLFVNVMVLKGLIGGVFLLYILWTEGLSFFIIFCGMTLCLPAFPALYTLCFQTVMAVQNLTVNEYNNYYRYRHFKQPNGTFKNPFHHGFVNNLLEFFYMRKPTYMQDRRDIFSA